MKLVLQNTWVLWYDDGTGNKGQSNVDYENSIKQLGTFNTIQVIIINNNYYYYTFFLSLILFVCY